MRKGAARDGASELKQERLDQEVVKAVERAGGTNFVQSEYIKEVAKVAIESESPTLTSVRPNVRIFNTEAWNKSLLIVLAFLKRYKMNQTVETVRLEYPMTPKSTGFSRASELEAAFSDLLALADDLRNVEFQERVALFEQDIEDELHRYEAQSPPRHSPNRSPTRSPPRK